MKKNTQKFISILIMILGLGLNLQAANSETESHDDHGSGKFETATFIFDHISDAYEWHIFSLNGHHYSIPLPVILISEHSGFHIFSSGHFHHGHDAYNGFEVRKEGIGKGKVVETLADGTEYYPIDLSITKNIASLLFSVIIILWLFLSIAKSYKNRGNSAPKGIQSFFEPLILFVRDEIAKPSIGHKHEKFLPYLLTIFFFIWINNILGLIPIFPGGANLTGNIGVTLTLALFTFVITTIYGNKNYWEHIFWTPGVPWWMKAPVPLMPIVEVVGMILKPVVLMIRLFANISAGHIIVLGFLSLIFIFQQGSDAGAWGISVPTTLFLIFMNCLELLVAFIQAYVFTFLSAIYFGMAVEEHH